MGINVTKSSRNITLHGLDVFGAGAGGVFLDGGDRVSLSRGDSTLTDSMVHGNSRWVFAMCPQIFMGGVGRTVENNEIYF